MGNQWKPNRMFNALLCWHIRLSDIDLAPKGVVEPFIREYHSWGLSNPKILDALKQNYDTDLYGLGSVACFF